MNVRHLGLLAKIYLTGLFFFTFYRLILLVREWALLSAIPDAGELVFQALVMGLRFDTVISGYFLILPLVVFSVLAHFPHKPLVSKWIRIFLLIMYGCSFFIILADIPYFHHYFSRMTTAIFQWTDSPKFMVLMVLQDWSYYIYFALFFGSIWLFSVLLNRYFRTYENRFFSFPKTPKIHIFQALVGLIMVLVCILGIRGRIAEKSPIRVGTAHFSNYAFPNQLGLNPVFTLMRSFLDDLKPENHEIHLAHPDSAIAFVRQEYHISDSFPDFPLARMVKGGPEKRYNIALVIMESMTAEKMTRFGNPDRLTPCLDSLYRNSIAFDRIYSAGIHTMNGIYSTLYSMPALLRQHPMNAVPIPRMSGLSTILKTKGYSTTYFTTHDDQFDNVGGFLKLNDFETIVSQKDYPSEKVKSTLGVPDHDMFEFAIPQLNEKHKSGKPFFAAFMTASDHGPYVLPTGIPFKPRHKEIRKSIVEYADWSIHHFLELASNQPWFDNTLFVFIADHGQFIGTSSYDVPLSFTHVPFIIHSPKNLKPAVLGGLGGQIDVGPTLLGILGMGCVNNSLGIDLLNETRPCMFFNFDDKIGVLDTAWFYIHRMNGRHGLYHYSNLDTKNHLQDEPVKARLLSKYGTNMMQAAQEVLKQKATGPVDLSKSQIGKPRGS